MVLWYDMIHAAECVIRVRIMSDRKKLSANAFPPALTTRMNNGIASGYLLNAILQSLLSYIGYGDQSPVVGVVCI